MNTVRKFSCFFNKINQFQEIFNKDLAIQIRKSNYQFNHSQKAKYLSAINIFLYFSKMDWRTVRNLSFFIRLCKSSLNLDNYFRQSALKASPITSLQWALEDTTSRTCTWLRLCKLKPRLEWRSETEVNCLSYGILEVKGYQVGILILRPNELKIFFAFSIIDEIHVFF